MKYSFCLLFVYFVTQFTVQAQAEKKWTLKACIEQAVNNNYQAAQSRLQLQRNTASLQQLKGNILPSLNASANHTYNTGRRIDPFTNQFANSVVLSQNFSLSSGVTLFSGLQNTHSISAAQLALKSSMAGNEQIDNDIALNVTRAFLQILLDEDLLSIASGQAQLAKEQMQRTREFYEAGRSARGDFLQAEAQVASDELNLVNARNQLELAKLNLAQLLAIESFENFEIQHPTELTQLPEMMPYNYHEIFRNAVDLYPAVRSADLQYLSIEKQLKAARSGIYPTLSAFGGIGTGYSQLSRTQTGSMIQQQHIGDFQGAPILIDVAVPIFEKTPIADQWHQNFNQTVGFSLNIPVFNNFRVKTQIANQKIALENARLQKLIVRNNLMREIQAAWLDAKSAYEKYRASEKNIEARKLAFEYISERFEAGLINSIEYNTGKNQYSTAQASLSQAKYEYLFKSLVLEYYRGKPLDLH